MKRPPWARVNNLQVLLMNSVSNPELDKYSKAERRCRRRILRYSRAIQSVMAHRAARPRQGRTPMHAPPRPPPPPPLAPRVIDPSNMDFLFEKRLQYSDVSGLGRIVIPKLVAELCFPPLDEKDGTWMNVDDMDCQMVWTFRFRFWLNCDSRMYLIDNAREFVLDKGLDWGDSVKWYKDRETGNYAVSTTKYDMLTKYQLGSDNNKNIIINAALLSPPPPSCLPVNTSQDTEKDPAMEQPASTGEVEADETNLPKTKPSLEDPAMEQLASTGEVEADETNPSRTKPSLSFIVMNPSKMKPSFSFIDLDDQAAALATTAYDELFTDPAQGDSFWNFVDDLDDVKMELPISLSLDVSKKLEDVPEPGSEGINPFSMFR